MRLGIIAAPIQEGERSLPEIHPLIGLCNAVSLAYAIPVAAFDTSKLTAASRFDTPPATSPT